MNRSRLSPKQVCEACGQPNALYHHDGNPYCANCARHMALMELASEHLHVQFQLETQDLIHQIFKRWQEYWGLRIPDSQGPITNEVIAESLQVFTDDLLLKMQLDFRKQSRL